VELVTEHSMLQPLPLPVSDVHKSAQFPQASRSAGPPVPRDTPYAAAPRDPAAPHR
jgi:hypothetical protein